MSFLPNLYLGTSIAISWAWGTSLILGMQIAQTKGVGAFLLWAAANCLTLVLFGQLYKRGVVTEKILEKPGIRPAMLMIQCFCLLIQMKVLYDVLLPFCASQLVAQVLTSMVGILFVLAMFRKGLSTSVLTDNFQGALTIVSLVGMLGVCFYEAVPKIPLPSSDGDAILWASWSGCILLSGIITDLQHWQRAKLDTHRYAFETAAGLFAFYLSLVFLLSTFQLNALAQGLLLVAVLGVTTSTIDSIAVALHTMAGKVIGTAVGVVLCITWSLFVSVGLLSLWSYAGIFRVALALVILSLGIYSYRRLR